MARYGGSFAPPLTADKLASYRSLADSASEPVKEAMLSLCTMAEVFQQTPESSLAGSPDPTGRNLKIPLEDAEIKRIWDYVPWDGQKLPDGSNAPNECKMLAELFDGISNATHKELRDAAFHLLWYAKELTRDREPMTADKLR